MLRSVSFILGLSIPPAAVALLDAGMIGSLSSLANLVLIALLYAVAAITLMYLASVRVQRLAHEVELEDNAAEAGLGNLDERVRNQAISHFKTTASTRVRIFVETLAVDALPLLGLSLLAAICAVGLLIQLPT